jgi:hypothetical protein
MLPSAQPAPSKPKPRRTAIPIRGALTASAEGTPPVARGQRPRGAGPNKEPAFGVPTPAPYHPNPEPRPTAASPSATRPVHYPLTAFATSFQDELAQYLMWREDPPSAVASAWKPSTVRQVCRNLCLSASVLARCRGSPDDIRSLADLVSPANAKLIVNWYSKHAGNKPTAYSGEVDR